MADFVTDHTADCAVVDGVVTVGIEEWEEVKNGNMVVGGILITLIIMIGLIILKIL